MPRRVFKRVMEQIIIPHTLLNSLANKILELVIGTDSPFITGYCSMSFLEDAEERTTTSKQQPPFLFLIATIYHHFKAGYSFIHSFIHHHAVLIIHRKKISARFLAVSQRQCTSRNIHISQGRFASFSVSYFRMILSSCVPQLQSAAWNFSKLRVKAKTLHPNSIINH